MKLKGIITHRPLVSYITTTTITKEDVVLTCTLETLESKVCVT